MPEEKEKNIGALWAKGEEDKRFLAGNITINGQTVDIVVFKNKYHGKDGKSPDYIIFKGKGKKQ